MFQRILTAIMISAGLAGCATTVPDLPPNFALDSNRTEGLAVVSLTLTGKSFNQVISFEYGIRAVPSTGTKVEQKQHFGSTRQFANWVTRSEKHRETTWTALAKGGSSEPADILDDGKAAGRLVTLRLPAGEYEFYNWKISEKNAYGEIEYGPTQTFSYRFTIRPGKAAYLGRLSLQFDGGTSYNLSVEDKNDVDVAAFRNRYPTISLDAAVMKEKSNLYHGADRAAERWLDDRN